MSSGAADNPEMGRAPGLRSVAAAALASRSMLAAGEPLKAVWRYAIVQLFDDYTSALRQVGVPAAAALFETSPPLVGDARVDAALAALAEHLARRDGWPAPQWTLDPNREATEWWFVTDLQGLHARALVESPLSFRKRGVFVTEDALVRV